ncbi:SAM-dependent methyltransferase [Actinomadura luteofluorescens]|uniref:SAM-dependent methyltransferase n=2 Tax=Actinomadura luteofluorescens TaxID=46163 RepID=A0A7Y9JHZ2_9ACTN|nr:class I SAM-dependent methyltransferase [Actinomadura luteofluorescens]NYD49281.1 SAM-dependent methyltransferase [Actinomadura luteofluorescens]
MDHAVQGAEAHGVGAERDQEEAVRRELETYYRSGRPPWDSGVTPPELVALVEGGDALPPGRALELGCGTGTNAVYLARHGWDVTAVDLIGGAVDQARAKATASGTAVRLLHGDATRLDELDAPGPYDLFFDLSCFCGIPPHRRDAYAAGLTGRAAPGALLLMFGYGPEAFDDPISGVTADELRARFPGWELVDATPGTNPVPTFWFTLRRTGTATPQERSEMHTVINVQQAEAWNGWEGTAWAENASRYDAMMGGFNQPLLELAAIGEDETVLDIGCGTGQLTLLAARRAARAVGVDISDPMLARARADAAEQGIGNARFDQADAQAHPFEEGGFDVVVSRGGVMFFSDPAAAFANIARALRPGGRMVFIVPQAGGPDSEYAKATAALAPLMRRPSPAARGMGSLSDPDRIRQVLHEAGLTDVTASPVQAPMDYGTDAADAADFVLGQGPVRYNLQDVDQSAITGVRQELQAALTAYETPDGVRIRGSVWLVSAIRP